jgi:hypothetical protein
MLHPQSLPASVAGHAVAVPQFVCSCTEGGLDAAAGELDVATTPQLVRTLRESESTGTADAVDIGDVAPAESPAETHQRSLVSSSLLKTGDWSRGRGA